MDSSRVAEALAECEFFEGLEPQDLERVAKLCTSKQYDAGEYVFRQGERGEHLYIICAGRVNLERSRNLGDRQGSVVFARLDRGNAFGGWSTLLGAEHTLMTSAFIQSPTKLIANHGPELRDVMLETQPFGFSVLERLCTMLHGRLQNVMNSMEKL